MHIIINFKSTGSTKTLSDIIHNFYENYPELGCNMKHTAQYTEKSNVINIRFFGDFENLTTDDINKIIRLTHHAEGFYEMTDAEYVHVEVCIDNTWYGKTKRYIVEIDGDDVYINDTLCHFALPMDKENPGDDLNKKAILALANEMGYEAQFLFEEMADRLEEMLDEVVDEGFYKEK